MAVILITGGTGLVGKKLLSLLLNSGHQVRVLSRRPNSLDRHNYKSFVWDIEAGKLDYEAILGVDVIIHLAGAGVAEKRWTKSYKKQIIESRVKGLELLLKVCKEKQYFPDKLISASGVAKYGNGNSSKLFGENDHSRKEDSGFLTDVVKKWEDASQEFSEFGVKRYVLRIGTVLSAEGGALSKMLLPFKLGMGSAFGTGQQPFPWIHIEDLVHMFLWMIEREEIPGIYNAVAPHNLNNETFSRALAKQLNVWYFLPNTPAFLLELLLGKQKANELLLKSAYVSSEKIQSTGFQFKHLTITSALNSLL